MTAGHILVSDDESATCEVFRDALAGNGHDVAVTSTAEEALERLRAEDFDVVVTDLHFEGMDGLELCSRIAANRPGVPVIVVTGFGSLDAAVGAIRAGAYDFVTKPVDLDALLLAVNRALQHRRLDIEVRRLRAAVEGRERLDSMVGSSEAMRKVFDLINRAAESDASVLVTGESGTGKELVARALHRSGPRKNGPFVAVDCTSIPATVLESELFGHVRGAFTDAKTERRGLFMQADGGTLFLDEIGEMPMEMQAKLLRALQERQVRPVGANAEVKFDARLIAATNRDLESEVAEGRIRQDLYYRINVVRVEMPPLRARGSDVLTLAQHFLLEAAGRSNKKIDGFIHTAAEKILSYDWPGNVRELMNCVEGAVALSQHDKVTLDDLPERIREHKASQLVSISNDPKDLLPMTEVERRYILRVLSAVGGNKTHAAKILGFERRTLYRKLKRYSIE